MATHKKGGCVSRIPPDRRTRRPRVRRVCAALGGLLLCLTLAGCSQDTIDHLKRLGLDAPTSDRAPYMHSLWIGAWIAAFIVGGIVWGLIIFSVIHFRRRSDDDVPRQIRYHLPLEVLYTVAPVIIVIVLFFFTVKTQDKVLKPVDNPQHSVLVTAQQWSWTFNYLHEPAADGKTVHDVGNTAHLPTLWLAKGQTVTFKLHSADVAHSFWVPSWYFKLDVLPGRHNKFSVTPTKLGTYDGKCAELCGYLHSKMLFRVHVVTPEQFNQHMKQLEKKGQVGLLKGPKLPYQEAGLDTGSAGGEK